MPTPIIEQIAVKIATAIATIAEGSGDAVTVTAVYRPETIDGFGRASPENYSVDMIYGDPVRVPEIDVFAASEVVGWDQPFEFFLNLKPSDDGGTPIEGLVEIFSSEVVKKIIKTPLWDGLAMNTFLGDQAWFINVDDGVVGKNIMAVVRYRVLKNDPYSQT